jgi:hypothetical protein
MNLLLEIRAGAYAHGLLFRVEQFRQVFVGLFGQTVIGQERDQLRTPDVCATLTKWALNDVVVSHCSPSALTW